MIFKRHLSSSIYRRRQQRRRAPLAAVGRAGRPGYARVQPVRSLLDRGHAGRAQGDGLPVPRRQRVERRVGRDGRPLSDIWNDLVEAVMPVRMKCVGIGEFEYGIPDNIIW